MHTLDANEEKVCPDGNEKSFGVSIAVTSVKNHLVEVFDSLLEKNEKTRDFFNSTNDAVEFSKITNKFF